MSTTDEYRKRVTRESVYLTCKQTLPTLLCSPKGRFLSSLIILLLMLTVGVSKVWAIDEGLYYIKSDANTDYYLCPSIGCYYGNNVDQPHLTTFQTGGDQYSIWKIVPTSETDTYYITGYAFS